MTEEDDPQKQLKRFQDILKKAETLPKEEHEEVPKSNGENLQIFMDFDDYVSQNAAIIDQTIIVQKKIAMNAYPELWSEQSKTHDDDITTKNSSLIVTRSARLYASLLYMDYQHKAELTKRKKENLN